MGTSALSAAAVRDIVRQRCNRAGLEGEFSVHSLRSGFVTEAGRQAIPIADTMAMTVHRSIQSVIGYTRLQSTSSAATKLLESGRQDSKENLERPVGLGSATNARPRSFEEPTESLDRA